MQKTSGPPDLSAYEGLKVRHCRQKCGAISSNSAAHGTESSRLRPYLARMWPVLLLLVSLVPVNVSGFFVGGGVARRARLTSIAARHVPAMSASGVARIFTTNRR